MKNVNKRWQAYQENVRKQLCSLILKKQVSFSKKLYAPKTFFRLKKISKKKSGTHFFYQMGKKLLIKITE